MAVGVPVRQHARTVLCTARTVLCTSRAQCTVEPAKQAAGTVGSADEAD